MFTVVDSVIRVEDALDTISHVAFDDGIHVVFDDTVTGIAFAVDDDTVHEDVDSVNVGGIPGCVTVMMRVTWGDPMVVVTVMVAVRELADVFAVTFRVTFP
ncbi:MAG: hypothetical protein FWF43_01920, partial [Propionibacteriaceae bacterium]|nr:hypothetical protein [Propionibacteriaceae bacterium]